MRFEFATAQRVVFGEGSWHEVGPLARSLGSRALLVTGRNRGRIPELPERLGSPSAWFAVSGEPTVASMREGATQAREAEVDLVIAVGGGSVIDAGKAIAALCANPGDPLRYLEGVGQGLPLERRPLPVIAVPTTAGTGSEVTRNAVLASPEHGVKVSLRHPWMLPEVALVDPELTYDLPPAITASTGLDALTQLIEPFVSTRANPMTDAFCREGLQRVARSLHRACSRGRDPEARRDMALASLLGGLALANSGLGAVHGLAAPLGGLKPIPHGVACAVLLPHVVDANLLALPQGHPALGRYEEVGRILTGHRDATAADSSGWLHGLVEVLGIPRLRDFGLEARELDLVARRSLDASSMKANPAPLALGTLVEILSKAL